MKPIPVAKAVSPYDVMLTVLLAAAWLLPNHYAPWNTFHTNAMVAGVLVVMAFRVLINHAERVNLSSGGVFILLVSVIPFAQYLTGQLTLPSDALLSFLFLFGFTAAYVFGSHWTRVQPGHAVGSVLIAATMAAGVSVGLQLYQWVGLAQDMGMTDIWVFPFPGGGRPFANLAQPNELASLLLWGVLGTALAWQKGWVGTVVGLALAVLCLFGVALTESRTAMLTLTLGVAYISIRGARLFDCTAVRTAQGLYAYYLISLISLEPLGRLVGQDASLTVLERSAGELRVALWRMALDAASQRPWLGYGWNRTSDAFLQVFPDHPGFANAYFAQSHSLPLDLVLWVGWPGAACLTLVCGIWLFNAVRSIDSAEQCLAVAALGVMLMHAMLELPLHHGFFLWPFGVLAGSVAANMRGREGVAIPRQVVGTVMVLLAVTWGGVVRDYLQVEAAFAEMRFQLLHIGRGHDETPPKTLLLTDWPEFIAMARATPHKGMSDTEIHRWESLLLYNTSPLAFKKVVAALALNGYAEKAAYWAHRSCMVLPEPACKEIQADWVLPLSKSPPSSP